MEILATTMIVALASSFALALLNKWGILEWLQVHAPSDFLNRLFSCHFCCSWWMCVIVSVIMLILTLDLTLIAVPFLSTPITVKLW